MSLIKKIALFSSLALGAISTAQAGPIFLGLGMDASGSISSSQFELQRNGYINVLSSLGQQLVDKEVWISINQFASGVRNELSVFEVTTASLSAGGAIHTALTDMNKLGGGTNIGVSINDLVSEFQSKGEGFFERAVIDISTDGIGTLGGSVNGALSAGIDQINCLGVGANANCGFAAGTDSFSITVGSFDDFESALTQKLQTEIGIDPTPVPEPSTLALLGIGLFGAGAMRFKRSV